MQLGSGRSAVRRPDPGPPAPESSSHTQWGHTGKPPTFSGDEFPLTVEWKPCTLLFLHSCAQRSTISGHSLKSVPRHRRGAHRSPAEQLWPDQGSAPPSALPPKPKSPLMPLTTQQTAAQTIRPHLIDIFSQDFSQHLDHKLTRLTDEDLRVTLSENDAP